MTREEFQQTNEELKAKRLELVDIEEQIRLKEKLLWGKIRYQHCAAIGQTRKPPVLQRALSLQCRKSSGGWRWKGRGRGARPRSWIGIVLLEQPGMASLQPARSRVETDQCQIEAVSAQQLAPRP